MQPTGPISLRNPGPDSTSPQGGGLLSVQAAFCLLSSGATWQGTLDKPHTPRTVPNYHDMSLTKGPLLTLPDQKVSSTEEPQDEDWPDEALR